MRARKNMTKTEKAFRWITAILEKKQIQFQVTGGFAAHIYGAKRPIADIDFDIPEKDFDVLVPEVQPFIVYGPQHHHDASWDVLVMTLEYEGQEIDIGGAYKTQLFNTLTQNWEPFSINFSTAEKKEVFGRIVPVCSKEELIAYKRKLNRKVDREDVRDLLSKE